MEKQIEDDNVEIIQVQRGKSKQSEWKYTHMLWETNRRRRKERKIKRHLERHKCEHWTKENATPILWKWIASCPERD